jgi:hypothetical protein
MGIVILTQERQLKLTGYCALSIEVMIFIRNEAQDYRFKRLSPIIRLVTCSFNVRLTGIRNGPIMRSWSSMDLTFSRATM